MAPRKKPDQTEEFPDRQVPLAAVSDLVRAANSAVLLPDIAKFNGEASPAEAKEWLRTIEAQAAIAQWNDKQKLETARRLLTNAGKAWYLLNADEIETWNEFRKLFFESFVGEEDSVIDKWERFQSRIQKEKETPREYVLDKLRLAKEVHASVRESKAAVCSGLRSAELAHYLKVFDYTKPSDFMKRLREFESLKLPKMSTVLRTTAMQSTSDRKPVAEIVTATSSSSSASENDSKKTMFCYNCRQKTDHLSRDCTQPKRPKYCPGCKTEGHSRRECPNASTMAQTPSTLKETGSPSLNTAKQNVVGTVSGASMKSGEKYIKTAVVNGTSVAGSIIDPGSNVCVIRAANAIGIGAKIEPAETRIYGVGDLESGTKVLGKITTSIVVNGVKAPDTEILIVPDKALPAPLLIGRTWTECPEVATIKWGNKFVITTADNDWFREFSKFESDELSEKNVVNFVKTEPVILTHENFNFGKDLTETERDQCLKLCNKYRDCFALSVCELGVAKVPPIDIQVLPGSKPAVSKPYHSNAADAEEMSRQIAEWREVGIVVNTTSAYAAPAFLVGKKGGKKRPVFDYRKLNEQVSTVHYPLPNIDEILAAIAGAALFGVIDLACGYFQFPLTKRAQELTAFITTRESGQFTVLPFGYKNAPTEFAKRMEIVWRKVCFLFKYLDEAIFTAKTFKEFLTSLEIVLQTLREYGLTARPEKCYFGVKKIEFLGFEISEGEVRPGTEKTAAIENFPVPRSVHQVRRFVGLTSFFRRFIERFAIRIAPLTNLTKKDQKFEWGESQQRSFNDVKLALTRRPVLGLFDPTAETELHTDASKDGIAGMLLQKRNLKEPPYLVYAVSKKTTDTEAKYHSSKLELLAIVWSITRLRQFLLGIRFVVVTDCQALLHLNANKTTNPQVARWALTLQEYDYVVHHRAGEKMAHVDALSRAPVNEAADIEEAVNIGIFKILSEEEIVHMYQHQDEYIRSISKDDKRFVKIDGIVYYDENDTGNKLFVVPKTMRKALCIQFHDQLGHFSAEKVFASMRRKYWFPAMRKYICVHVRNCVACILAKNTSGKVQGLLHPIPAGKRPFETCHVDHLGPFVETLSKNSFVFVLVDNFTKFVCLYAVPNTSTDQVEVCLRDVFLRFSIPDRIVSDQGTCFTSAKYEMFCNARGIVPHPVAVRHPRANGQCERVNRILNAQLIIYASQSSEETEDWDRFIPEIQRNINMSVNRSTGRTPFELLHGYTPRIEESTLARVIDKADHTEDIDIMREIAQEHIAKAQEVMKKAFDRRHCVGDNLQIGEIVFYKVPVPGKLAPRFRGPMVVVERIGRNIYRVQDLRREGTPTGLTDLHISQLRPWKLSPEEPSGTGEADLEEIVHREASSEDATPGRTAECRKYL